MLNFEKLQNVDKKRMYEIYDKWPEISQDAYDSSFQSVEFEGIDHIVFAGMGGSGTIGSIFASILSKTNIHVSIVKGYILPKTVDSETLVITTSVSGNTDETLTILDVASKQDCKIFAFSSGGNIEQYCKENRINYQKIPMIHSPRASFPSFLYSMLKILQPIIPIPSNHILESINELHKLRDEINSENLSDSNSALNLAEWISGIPLIYYPAGLQAAAIRFKNSLQENAKMHAITEDVIESCHNGIVSWEQPSNIVPIMIQGEEDYFKTKERWGILKEFFDEKNIEYKDIFSGSGNILTKLMKLIYLLDYASIYKAVLNGVDPTPVEPINFIKKKL